MAHAKTLLERKDQSFRDVVGVLTGLRDSIDEPDEDEDDQEEEGAAQRFILSNLIAFLDAID